MINLAAAVRRHFPSDSSCATLLRHDARSIILAYFWLRPVPHHFRPVPLHTPFQMYPFGVSVRDLAHVSSLIRLRLALSAPIVLLYSSMHFRLVMCGVGGTSRIDITSHAIAFCWA
jgi:hypothetical protein